MYNRLRLSIKKKCFARISQGFTLIELLVVMVIIGISASLVAPKLFEAYDGIRAAAEEQKVTDIIETVKMRAFLRQVPYTMIFKNNLLMIKNKDRRLKFEFISFPCATITFNSNGFAASGTLRYIVQGEKKSLDLNPAVNADLLQDTRY